MNYQKHYDALIERARNRTIEGYKERHHVVPRCIGGSDDPSNLVALTAEEHYVAHQLLVKIHPKEHKLAFAVHMLTLNLNSAGARSENKRYGWLRRLHAASISGMLKGRKLSKRNLEAIIKTNTGRSKTKEEIDKIRRAMASRVPSERCRQAAEVSCKMRGKTHSPETIAKMKESQQLRRYKEKQHG